MILDALLNTRATKVTGGSPQNPQYWVQRLFGGGGQDTAAGVVVNEDTALNISAVWNAINVLADALAGLPWPVYEWLDKDAGTKKPARKHPLWRLLNKRPNPRISASRFRKYLEACRGSWGNGYAEIEKTGGGTPLALWPIHPSFVTPDATDAGDIFYKVRRRDQTEDVLLQHEMYHVMWHTKDGINGLSPIQVAAESLGLTMAAEAYGANFFGNDCTPNGIVRSALPVGDKGHANFVEEWKDTHKGPTGKGVPAVLDGGMEWQSIGMPNEDVQFLETRLFQILEICRWYNVPPHKLKELSNAHFTNIGHSEIEFAKGSVKPIAIEYEDEATLKLLSEQEQERYFIEFNLDGLMRGDPKARAEHHEVMQRIGAYSINMILRKENENPIGPEGDVRLVNSAMTTLDRIINPPDPPPVPGLPAPDDEPVDDDEDDKGERSLAPFRPVLYDAFARLARKESKRAHWACGKFEGDELRDSILTFYAKHDQMAADTLAPVLASVRLATGLELDAVAICKRHVAESRDALVSSIGRPQQMARTIAGWEETGFVERVDTLLLEELNHASKRN